MPKSPHEREALRDRSTLVLPGFKVLAPAEEFRRLAAWCEAGGVEYDRYGEGALVADFERKIATLLGKPAATFFPSGVMAQLAAVRNVHLLLLAQRAPADSCR